MATSRRPHGFAGRPLPVSLFSSLQVFPPSALRRRVLPLAASGPSPPERNVQPLRRKSHSPAINTSGSAGSMLRLEQPVDRLVPLRTWVQVLPPSVVL